MKWTPSPLIHELAIAAISKNSKLIIKGVFLKVAWSVATSFSSFLFSFSSLFLRCSSSGLNLLLVLVSGLLVAPLQAEMWPPQVAVERIIPPWTPSDLAAASRRRRPPRTSRLLRPRQIGTPDRRTPRAPLRRSKRRSEDWRNELEGVR